MSLEQKKTRQIATDCCLNSVLGAVAHCQFLSKDRWPLISSEHPSRKITDETKNLKYCETFVDKIFLVLSSEQKTCQIVESCNKCP